MSQAGMPRGWFGRLLVRGMNRGHFRLTRWGLSGVEIPQEAAVLDIGCGGGRTLEHLAARAVSGKAVGIDRSKDALSVARKRNRRLIASGRVAVIQGAVSSMPFATASFELVTAIETCYFWPDLAADLAEVRRVMKPGGQLVIVCGMYRGSRFDRRNQRLIGAGGMRVLSVKEFEETLQPAGFASVAVAVAKGKGWIRVVSTNGGPS